jgi:hypothetical protein
VPWEHIRPLGGEPRVYGKKCGCKEHYCQDVHGEMRNEQCKHYGAGDALGVSLFEEVEYRRVSIVVGFDGFEPVPPKGEEMKRPEK